MSFIYQNSQLIKELMKMGVADINKYAAPPSNQLPQAIQLYQLALKMGVDLGRQLDPNAAPAKLAPVGYTDPSVTETPLDVSSLRTLGDFLQWAAKNKITWGGKRVAWTDQETPDEGAFVFDTYHTARERDADTREIKNIIAYASKPELIQLLTHLRDSTEAKSNKVFQVMLNKIISQANEYLEPAEKISTKPAEAVKADLDPRAVVDSFMDSYLDDPKKYSTGLTSVLAGQTLPVPLTVADLSSRSAFVDWLRGMYRRIPSPTGGTSQSVSVLDPDHGDPCTAVHILFLRAKYLASVATDTVKPNYSKMADLYLKAVQDFGKTFTDKHGRACPVVSPVSTGESKTEPDMTAGDQVGITTPGGTVLPSGMTSVEANQLLEQLVQSLPLSTFDVDLNRMLTFLNLYGRIASTNSSVVINDARARLSQVKYQIAQSALNPAKMNFRLTRDAAEFMKFVKPPQGNYAMSLADALDRAVALMGEVLQVFYNEYARTTSSRSPVRLTPEQKALVEGQVIGGSSIYQQNVRDLQVLMANIQSLVSGRRR